MTYARALDVLRRWDLPPNDYPHETWAVVDLAEVREAADHMIGIGFKYTVGAWTMAEVWDRAGKLLSLHRGWANEHLIIGYNRELMAEGVGKDDREARVAAKRIAITARDAV